MNKTRPVTLAGLTTLSDAQIDMVAGGFVPAPAPPPPTGGSGGNGNGHGATLIGGYPPTLIITPNGRAIEPGTGPVVLRP